MENLKEHTIIAERLVYVHVRNVGGILNVELSKPLLLSVKLSRQRYERNLEDERTKKKTQQEQSKRKSLLEKIEKFTKKERRVDSDIKSLLYWVS